MTDEEHLREVIHEREHTIKVLHDIADVLERNIWELEARAETAEKECEDHKRALAYQVAQFSDLMRRAEAAEKRVRDIWDWWYGEKRGHATQEEFAAFLEAKP